MMFNGKRYKVNDEVRDSKIEIPENYGVDRNLLYNIIEDSSVAQENEQDVESSHPSSSSTLCERSEAEPSSTIKQSIKFYKSLTTLGKIVYFLPTVKIIIMSIIKIYKNE